MFRKITAITLVLLLTLTACGSRVQNQTVSEPAPVESETVETSEAPVAEEPEVPAEPEVDTFMAKAVFRGVEGYGKVMAYDIKQEGAAVYKFEIDGKILTLPIKLVKGFDIQNHLMEGYNYDIVIEDGTVTSVELLDELPEYDPVVKPEPGLRTLKNFLMTAFEPMGTALYVYGGNWNWQDNGSSVQSTHIGVPGTWVNFYNSQDAGYKFADDYNKSESYYPYGEWNEFYFAGTDCSGFTGWVVYNTINTEDGNEGYVTGATRQSRMLAEEYGFGTWTHEDFNSEEDPLRPGDMVSTPTHVWICVGKCEDGSVLVLHSTVTKSIRGMDGGGVQLSAISKAGYSKDCDAYRLAEEYTEKYFPDWAQRYPVVMKGYGDYVNFPTSNSNVGRFRWYLDGENGLSDPDGYADMSAEEVLKDIFGED